MVQETIAEPAPEEATDAQTGSWHVPRVASPVVMRGPKQLEVFMLNAKREIRHKWMRGSTWYPSGDTTDLVSKQVAATPMAIVTHDGNLRLFKVGFQSRLWGMNLDAQPREWVQLPVTPQAVKVVGAPAAVCRGNDLHVCVLGGDSRVYHGMPIPIRNRSAMDFAPVPGAQSAYPPVVTMVRESESPPRPRQVDVFWTGLDQRVYQIRGRIAGSAMAWNDPIDHGHPPDMMAVGPPAAATRGAGWNLVIALNHWIGPHWTTTDGTSGATSWTHLGGPALLYPFALMIRSSGMRDMFALRARPMNPVWWRFRDGGWHWTDLSGVALGLPRVAYWDPDEMHMLHLLKDRRIRHHHQFQDDGTSRLVDLSTGPMLAL